MMFFLFAILTRLQWRVLLLGFWCFTFVVRCFCDWCLQVLKGLLSNVEDDTQEVENTDEIDIGSRFDLLPVENLNF